LKSKKIDEASKKGKRGKVKDTKKTVEGGGSEGIRGDCPGPT